MTKINNMRTNLLKESMQATELSLRENGYELDTTMLASLLKSDSFKESYFDTLLSGYATTESLNEATYAGTASTAANAHHLSNVQNVRALMENATNSLLLEAAGSAGLRYYASLTFPLIKRQFIACTAKNVIPVEVPDKPIFKKGIEKLYAYNPKTPGKKYELQDIFFNEEGMADLNSALRTRCEHVVTLASGSATANLIALAKAETKVSTISRDFKMVEVHATIDTKEVVYKQSITPVSGQNMISLSIDEKVATVDGTDEKQLTAKIFANVDYTTGEFTVTTSNPAQVKAVKVTYSISNENNFNSISFDWGHEEREFQIPDGDHYNISIPQEWLHDAKALYSMDMQAKLTELCGTFIEHKKDKEIYDFLDDSFDRLKHPFAINAKFDLKPSASFHGLPTEWAGPMFKKRLSQIAGVMKKKLHIKDCYFAVVGNPFDINELRGDIKWVYGSGEMGGIQLDYKFGLMEDDIHNYTITSTDRIPQGQVKIYLIPTNDEQFTYKHFQYAFYVSNAYASPVNNLLPNVMISDRHLTEEFTPVQAQVTIINNDIGIIDRPTDSMFS
ncbi:MAG: hypothetical protein ACRCXX_02400 [Cetobacterium sp.]|uniref:hypothetical protein n=1 Tax=Cetobacterium sp. TaxID=2071632 RepID=UPI003F37632E